jgi:XTP/dITP diphosphohydrolase
MQMTLYIATSNPGKLRDFAAATSTDMPIAPLPGLNEIPPPHEDQPTFEGNARLKAIYYSQHLPNQIVIADDSGLEVDALNGAPGVRSARYADDQHFPARPSSSSDNSNNIDERNNLCLVQALSKFPTPHKGRYRCVLAAARNCEVLAIGDGTVEGEILLSSRGDKGFGYDPLFYLPTHKKTMAELDITTKLAFSHRGRAFVALLNSLTSDLSK